MVVACRPRAQVLVFEPLDALFEEAQGAELRRRHRHARAHAAELKSPRRAPQALRHPRHARGTGNGVDAFGERGSLALFAVGAIARERVRNPSFLLHFLLQHGAFILRSRAARFWGAFSAAAGGRRRVHRGPAPAAGRVAEPAALVRKRLRVANPSQPRRRVPRPPGPNPQPRTRRRHDFVAPSFAAGCCYSLSFCVCFICVLSQLNRHSTFAVIAPNCSCITPRSVA